MNDKLTELTTLINQHESLNEDVSKVPVGWHINHALLVINGVCLSLMRSKEEEYEKRFNIKKTYVFTLGMFPRGKGRAPKATSIQEEITVEGIQKQLANTHKLLGKIETLEPKNHFNHLLFGVLDLKESKKFLKIHTEHHLKIIRDVLK